MDPMEEDHLPENITRATFNKVLARYDEFIRELSSSPSTSRQPRSASSLQELDQWRLNELPATVQKRAKGNDGAWLDKSEMEGLMRWKLMHGKFRPRLMQLLAKNKSDDVRRVTREAFTTYSSSSTQGPGPALEVLCSLSGIGPATASLVLSIYDPIKVPFFSDECFLWMMFEEGKGKGWDRRIQYDAKTYKAYFERVQALRRRLSGEEEIRATDVERVGFVLVKEAELASERVTLKRVSKRSQADANIQDVDAPAGKRAQRR